MIEKIKAIILDELKENEISLAMIFNRSGNILWHRGREIRGKSIEEGQGFSRSLLDKIIKNPVPTPFEDNNIFVSTVEDDTISESARNLRVKSVIVLPVSDRFFFYVDSGSKKSFGPDEIKNIHFIGKILTGMLDHIQVQSTNVGGISGNSAESDKIREQVLNYAIEEEPVLLLGETGVGKSHVAELIHRYSGRNGKFVIVDTPNIQDKLLV